MNEMEACREEFTLDFSAKGEEEESQQGVLAYPEDLKTQLSTNIQNQFRMFCIDWYKKKKN